MANNDLWIITDYQNHDKIQELNAMKNAVTKRPEIAAMHIFYNFDIFSQQASDIGSSMHQILDGLTILLSKQKRLPHTMLICMGDQLLTDRDLMKDMNQVQRVLSIFCKRIVQLISNWISGLPPKAKPERLPRIYITKPLPIPEKFFQGRIKYLEKLINERKNYISELVKAVKSAHIGFINSNLTINDGDMFERITSQHNNRSEKVILNPKGLTQYWKSISQNLYNLAWDAATAFANKTNEETSTRKEQRSMDHKDVPSTIAGRLGYKNYKKHKNFNKAKRDRFYNQ